jgi:hypothetical protein
MPDAIRRTNLSRNAASQRYIRISQTDDQREAQNEVNGIEIINIEMLHLTPIELHSIIT